MFLVLSVALVANGRPEDRKRRYLNNICSSLFVGVVMVVQRMVPGGSVRFKVGSRARERDNSVAPFSRAEKIVLLPESRKHREQ